MEALKPPGALTSARSVLSSAALAAMDAAKLNPTALAAMQALTSQTSAAAAMNAAKLNPTALAAMQALTSQTSAALAAMDVAKLSPNALAAMQALASQSSLTVGDALRLTQTSDAYGRLGLSTWTEALGRTLGQGRKPTPPRRRRNAADFFAPFEVEIHSRRELLRALAVIQDKNSHLSLVWRGQQDAAWPVDSSLTRRLREEGHSLGEKEMVAVERFQMLAADRWGVPRTYGDLNFLAELQHDGAPTRLIDVSFDPDVALWFAVQESADHDDRDARLLAWGRSPAAKRRKQVEEPPTIPTAGGEIFWQSWTKKKDRLSNDWGTGRAVLSWQPALLNERMRAQRAAFLFDAEPIVGSDLLSLFSDELGAEWKPGEIARATRIVGFPSPHDRVAKPNSAGIVPMFTLRIKAEAKEDIRRYLKSKRLIEETIYPDRAGLTSFLRRVGVGP